MPVSRQVTVGSLPVVDPTTPAGQKPASHPSWAGPLVFSDEFGGGVLDGRRWITSYPPGGSYLGQSLAGHLSNGHGAMPSDGSADEPQLYHPSAVTVAEGLLTLTMVDGVHPDYAGESWAEHYRYTSGMVCSWPALALPGGYFEARLRCDPAPGAWPAFWALSAGNALQWPPEIDVVEYWGDSPSWAQYGGYQAGTGQIGAGGHPATGTMDDWHIFGCHYLPGQSVAFYCDGTPSGARAISFTDPIFLVANLAGDHRPGMNPEPADMPIRAQIDWIRAWALPA